MSEQVMEYKGFKSSIEYSSEDDTFVGKVLDIESLILFSGVSVVELRKAFETSIDEYLKACARNKAEPEKPYSGTFNVRVGGELHRSAAVVARRRGQKLNELVKRAIAAEVVREDIQRVTVARICLTQTASGDISSDIYQEDDVHERVSGWSNELLQNVTAPTFSVKSPLRH
jgi:predicted HicB family RNase H-like nuclease